MSVVLAGVDLAAFAVALVERMRRGDVAVSPDGAAVFVDALRRDPPADRERLYWTVRLCLVSRADDLPAFDAVFASVFADAVLALDPTARRTGVDAPGRRGEGASAGRGGSSAAVPWVTRARGAVVTIDTVADSDAARAVPDVLPSRIVAREGEPFADFDAADLALIGAWFERAALRWPQRRTRRREAHPQGRYVDLRASMNASRRTGWEPMRLVHSRPRRRPRRIVLICDVSRSMQPYASTYLHLMRAAVRRDAEVFAFATSVTRLTAVLAHRSAEVAIARANRVVTDRYGGTHIAAGLRTVLASPHGSALRGAVVVIGSDGWDSDDPAELASAMARIRRRAHRVVWLNPRAAEPRYRPLAGAMAAALPYCDAFLPAHSIAALREVLPALAGYEDSVATRDG